MIIIYTLTFLTVSGCRTEGRYTEPEKIRFFALDTLATITVYSSDNGSDVIEILESCKKLCDDYENLFSRTREGSDIYRINHANGNTTAVSDDTFYLISESLRYSESSGGLFDITIAPVMDLWGFGDSDINTLPDEKKLSEALSHVSYKNIILDENTCSVTLRDPEAMLDLGALAKGYIADRIREHMTESGITSAVIDLGGNILTIGKKPDGSAFNIGIKAPFPENDPLYPGKNPFENGIADSVKVYDKSVVTSGIYERYKQIGEGFYHHIIDPFTGYPAENTLASVTIITDTSLKGDLLSTTCLLLGREEAIKLIESASVQAVLIEKNGRITRK